jgi:hypothetical protein
MNAPIYFAGRVRVEWRDHPRGRYIVAILPVTTSDGHRGSLIATQHRDGWWIGSADGDVLEDGSYWSPWVAVEDLRRSGVLEARHRGPGTYGHTDYYLTPAMVADEM